MRLIDADALRADYFVTSTTTNTPLHRYVSMEQIANAPTVELASPWHRVEERLPDDSREVIIITTSKIIGVGSFIRPNWYQWYSGGGLPVDVTHWMPLPEPPKEEA